MGCQSCSSSKEDSSTAQNHAFLVALVLDLLHGHFTPNLEDIHCRCLRISRRDHNQWASHSSNGHSSKHGSEVLWTCAYAQDEDNLCGELGKGEDVESEWEVLTADEGL